MGEPPDDPARAVLDALTRAAHDKRSAMRWPVLATAVPDGGAEARILVVRHFDREARIIEFHTHKGSEKVAALRADPGCELLFFDKSSMVQLRVSGTASVHTDDETADAAWARAPKTSWPDYAGPDPGQPLKGAESWDPGEDGETARKGFAAIRIRVEHADRLKVARDGHVRHAVDFSGDEPEAQRLTP